ncbi:MAG: ABC transporter permease [Candidatus Sumerlaeia bacterium]|nr:ABC transporter permease [Candidatus Sumerlaeia bacterium]
MWLIALKMLFGDQTKYLGLVLGVAFSTLLICQQLSIFVGLLNRSASVINDIPAVDIWVSDPSVNNLDRIFPMRDTETTRVRGVEGVAWAVPLFKAQVSIRTPQGTLDSGNLIGVDDTSLVGVPDQFLHGSLESLFLPDSIVLSREAFSLLFPGKEFEEGLEIELNDRRARIVGVTSSSLALTGAVTVFCRYSLATQYTNNGRNQLSFVLAKVQEGAEPAEVARRITEVTGLRAHTRPEFKASTIAYIINNTGIPISFGVVVFLGIIVGIAIVGLTFNQFIVENIRQYGALKALGVSNRTLTVMTMIQAATVGIIGYGLGLGVAAAFFYFVPPNSNGLRGFFLPPEVCIFMAVVTVMIMLLSMIAGLRKVFRIDPADVFRS